MREDYLPAKLGILRSGYSRHLQSSVERYPERYKWYTPNPNEDLTEKIVAQDVLEMAIIAALKQQGMLVAGGEHTVRVIVAKALGDHLLLTKAEVIGTAHGFKGP